MCGLIGFLSFIFLLQSLSGNKKMVLISLIHLLLYNNICMPVDLYTITYD